MFTHNEIINGDCNEVLRTFPDACVDLVITDPPYLCNYRDRHGRTIANDRGRDRGAVLGAFNDIYRVMRPDTYCVCFYGWQAVPDFFAAWTDAGFKPVGHIVWHKNYASRTGVLRSCHEQAYVLAKGRPAAPAKPLDDVQPWVYSGNKFHPTEKAVAILTPLVRSFSREGATVLDSFAGSCSTLVAAALTNRQYVGIELESKYVDLGRRRLAGVERARARRFDKAA
jgi:DNA modification methylase